MFSEKKAELIARALGGVPLFEGGGNYNVGIERADGHFVVLGEGGATIYDSPCHYERYSEGLPVTVPEALVWEGPDGEDWTDRNDA